MFYSLSKSFILNEVTQIYSYDYYFLLKGKKSVQFLLKTCSKLNLGESAQKNSLNPNSFHIVFLVKHEGDSRKVQYAIK